MEDSAKLAQNNADKEMSGALAERRTLRVSWILGFCSLLVSLAFVYFIKQPEPHDDAVLYWRAAQNIADGRGYSIDGRRPFTHYDPGYSFILGAYCWASRDCSAISARTFNAILLSFCVWIIYLLAQRFMSPWWASLTALLVLLNPITLTNVAYILTEPPLTFWTLVYALLLFRWLEKPGIIRSALCGLAAGAYTLTKSIFLFLPFLSAGVLVLLWRTQQTGYKGQRYREIIFFLAVFLLSLLPWIYRNYEVTEGRLRWFDSHGDATLPAIASRPEQLKRFDDYPEWHMALDRAQSLGINTDDEIERSRFIQQETFRRILQQPGLYLKLLGGRLIKFWTVTDFNWLYDNQYLTGMSLSEARERFGYLGLIRAFDGQLLVRAGLKILYMALYLLAILGSFHLIRQHSSSWIVVTIILYYWFFYSLIWIDARYNTPLIPFYILLAMSFIASFGRRKSPDSA